MTTATWYHSTMKTVSRSKGRSVVAAAAYRLSECLHDELHNITHDYRRKRGVEAKFTLAPADAPVWVHDAEALWNAAEQAEKRINSTVGREIELALPAFLSPKERQQIVERFAGELVNRYKVAVTVAIHSPSREGDDRNFHAHILFTTREMTPDGLGCKTRILDAKATGKKEVVTLRALAADIINDALAAANSDTRVDHRSFAERGIEREGTIHLGPNATSLERRGEATRGGDYNRHVEDYNQQLAERDALNVAIEKEERYSKSPPPERVDATERVFSDVEAFREAVKDRGAVADIQDGDGVYWWQRVASRLLQKARNIGVALSRKTRAYWQQNTRDNHGPDDHHRDDGGLDR